MRSRLLAALVATLCLLGAGPLASADPTTHDLPDGGKEQYEVDDQGRKHGPYTRWHPQGQIAVQASYDQDRLDGLVRTWDVTGAPRSAITYKRGVLHGAHKTYDDRGQLVRHKGYRDGQLHGAWKSYYPNRRLELTTSYRAGKQHGAYHLRANDGSTRIKTTYKDGLRHGTLRAFEGKKTLTKQTWRQGVPVNVDGINPYPREQAPLVAELKRLLIGDGGISAKPLEADRELALRYLKAYRCISGVPYDDIAIDPRYQAHAQAAAEVCRDLGHITHFPANPGWDAARFDFAATGTKSSNLAQGCIACESIRAYMDDSDERNIAKVGHRAWCMNPAMTETGFGTVDRFSAMWSISGGRKSVPDYEFVACPPAGHAPGPWFGTHWAWSVSLHPKRFDAPRTGAVKVVVQPVDETFLPQGAALELNHLSVLQKSAGIPYMIVFRPVGVSLAAGSRYRVTIRGLTAKGKPRTLRYYTAFFDFSYVTPSVTTQPVPSSVLSR